MTTYSEWLQAANGDPRITRVRTHGESYAVVDDQMCTWACLWSDYRAALKCEVVDDDSAYTDFCTLCGSVDDEAKAALRTAGYAINA